MASARARIAYARAKRLMNTLTEAKWFEMIWDNYTPLLRQFLEDNFWKAEKEKRVKKDGVKSFEDSSGSMPMPGAEQVNNKTL